MVAEDEALIRMDLVEMLGELGYLVVGEAADGQTAIDLAKAEKPDVVLLDIKMPKLDGIAAAREISKLAPVVMLTAFSQAELAAGAAEAGAMAYLVKPFTQADLLPAIEVARTRFADLASADTAAASLTEQLETRKLVDRAKAALMAQGLSESEAFSWLQKAAMDQRITMREVAEAVVNHRG